MVYVFGKHLGPVYTGTCPNETVPKQLRIGLKFIMTLMEPLQTEPLAVPKGVSQESRSRVGPNPKSSRANIQNGSHQVRLETIKGKFD